MLVLAGAGRGQTPPTTGGVTVLPVEPSAFQLIGNEKGLGRIHIEDVNDKPFDKSFRITTEASPVSESGIQLVAPTMAAIKAGDVLLARFWLRCHDSMTGEGFTTFLFELAEEDHAKAAEFRVSARSDWRQVNVPFRAPRSFVPGQGQAVFRVGFDRQTIDIGGVQLINYGPDVDPKALPRTRISYAGRDSHAPWREEAAERIERIRKAELKVRLLDRAGRPVEGAVVQAKLKRHSFGFGSAVTVEHLLGNSDDACKYREVVERYFNTAVFENDMKWPGNFGAIRPDVDVALDWLLRRDFRVRGHNLLWPSWRWLPEELHPLKNDPDAIRRHTNERVTQAVKHFKGKLIHWDVVNEPYSEHDLLDMLGQDAMVEWFKLAKQADPSCEMYLNDYGIFDGGSDNAHREHFDRTIQSLIDHSAPIDGIGIQSHFGSILPTPTQLLAVLDRFGRFGLPIESTEVSLNLDDRELQADYMRDYLTVLFSHPKVTGIMLWGFWEGRHWRPEAALWERDWSPRPVAKIWIEQIHQHWKTDETRQTGSDGVATLRGFLGTYEVTVSRRGKSQVVRTTLDRDGTDLMLTED